MTDWPRPMLYNIELPWPNGPDRPEPTPASEAMRAILEEKVSGCPTCIHCPPPGERCPQEDLGNSPTWRTRKHGVGCPRRKVKTTTEEEQN